MVGPQRQRVLLDNWFGVRNSHDVTRRLCGSEPAEHNPVLRSRHNCGVGVEASRDLCVLVGDVVGAECEQEVDPTKRVRCVRDQAE